MFSYGSVGHPAVLKALLGISVEKSVDTQLNWAPVHAVGGAERERWDAAEDQGDALLAAGRRQEGVRRGGQGEAVAPRAVSSKLLGQTF